MSTNDNVKPVVPPPVIKEEEAPPKIGNDEYTEPKSCANCIHQVSCGPYWLMKRMVSEMHKEFGYMIRFPMPLTMLAGGCKEYLDKRKIVKPDKE